MKSILFNNACVITAHFLLFAWAFPFFKGISRVVTFLALFNFQDAVLLPAFWAVKPFYYITSSQLCQVLFSSFFKKLFPQPLPRCLRLATAYLLYHISYGLSTLFSIFLEKIFRCDFHISAVVPWRHVLLYHTFYRLSTQSLLPFFFFFCIKSHQNTFSTSLHSFIR